METLVAFYSRTGNTKKVGKEIAKNLNADFSEIIDLKNRKGFISLITAGKDATKKKLTKIEYKKDPSKYDLVVVGTPVWAGNLTPAIRTYLSQNKFKKIAFFCTCVNNKGNCFNEMEKLSKKPVLVLELTSRKIKDYDKIKEFCKSLK